jgi:hypothetical protein
MLNVELHPLGTLEEELPLELALVATDGTPSADRGFGVGLRVEPLPMQWAIPRKPEGKLRASLPIKSLLEFAGVYRAGLITLFVAARVPGDAWSDGMRSNQLTLQIAENTERMRVAHKAPVEPLGGSRKPDPKPKPDKSKSGKGGSKPPEPGEVEPPPEGNRIPHAVKPLLSDGPSIEKEVEVFERERGGEGAPPPAPPPPAESPSRIFLRRAEEAIPQLALSPHERRLLRAYWESVQRRG